MYGFVRFLAHLYVNGWYRVEVVGEPFPEEGPLLVAANHTNGLMDVALLLDRAPRPLRFLAKFKIFELPLIGTFARWVRAIPVYRKKDNVPTELNQSSFAAVHAALRAGEAIAVFPEGESGTSPRLRPPLKTGIARMALGAAESLEGLDVRLLPLGVHVHDRDRFRSRIELRVGEPISVLPYLDAFRVDPREAVPRLMAALESGLTAVGPDLRDDEDLPLLQLARGAWRAPDGAHHERLARWTARLAGERRADPAAADARAREGACLLRELRARGRTPDGLPPPVERPFDRGWPVVLAVCGLVWGLPVALGRLAARRAAPPDKFVTVTALVAPLAGTLLLGVGALLLLGAGRWALGLALVPAGWALLALGIRACDARIRRRSGMDEDLTERVEALLTRLIGATGSATLPVTPRPNTGGSGTISPQNPASMNPMRPDSHHNPAGP